jgi:hypothetical protein
VKLRLEDRRQKPSQDLLGDAIPNHGDDSGILHLLQLPLRIRSKKN